MSNPVKLERNEKSGVWVATNKDHPDLKVESVSFGELVNKIKEQLP